MKTKQKIYEMHAWIFRIGLLRGFFFLFLCWGFFEGSLYGEKWKQGAIWVSYERILQHGIVETRFEGKYGKFYQNSFEYNLIYKKKNQLKKVRALMKEQMNLLKKVKPPSIKKGERKELLAFWINVYNFYTLHQIMKAYPIKSMKQVGWKKKECYVGGKRYSLDHVEHKILRPMGDARIHFAINCAAVSCPSLGKKPFMAKDVYQRMDALVRNSLKSPLHLWVDSKQKNEKIVIRGTKLFDWFGVDFKTKPYHGPLSFVQLYGPKEVRDFMVLQADLHYDWNMNTSKNLLKRMKMIAKKMDKTLKVLD